MASRIWSHSQEKEQEAIEAWVHQLSQIPWLPVLTTPLVEYIPWRTDTSTRHASAAQVRPQSDAWFASHSMFLLDGHVASNQLQVCVSCQA